MEKHLKPASGGNSQKNHAKGEKHNPETVNGLRSLFVDELKDIYWAEKALTKALPKMIKKASSPDLVHALESHLDEPEKHVERVEQVFRMIGEKVEAKKCEAMEGLMKEAEGIIESTPEGVVRDAGIISAGQKVEHYEIATYGTLCAFAKTLREDQCVSLLEATLTEEKAADKKLTEIALTSINVEAAAGKGLTHRKNKFQTMKSDIISAKEEDELQKIDKEKSKNMKNDKSKDKSTNVNKQFDYGNQYSNRDNQNRNQDHNQYSEREKNRNIEREQYEDHDREQDRERY